VTEVLIISHKYKFIFIKTRKTAGSSIEVGLSKVCGTEDIVTPLTPAVDGHKPRNHHGFTNHIKASRIKAKVSAEIWNNYLKFAFERNPFDKVVSWYWWRKKRHGLSDTFDEFIEKCTNGKYSYRFPVDYDKYAIDGKVVVDFIGRYESLQDDLKQIYQRLGIPFEDKLTYQKDDSRKDKNDYRTFYNEDTKKLISNMFHREISLLGYEF
jgi:hypothetical protein